MQTHAGCVGEAPRPQTKDVDDFEIPIGADMRGPVQWAHCGLEIAPRMFGNCFEHRPVYPTKHASFTSREEVEDAGVFAEDLL
jgi:hypothetical protein